MVLPHGVRGQAEMGEIVEGSEPGAPVESNIKRKFKMTTIIATILWVIICSIIWSGLVSWDQLAALMGLNKP